LSAQTCIGKNTLSVRSTPQTPIAYSAAGNTQVPVPPVPEPTVSNKQIKRRCSRKLAYLNFLSAL
jgi:hypothetical protein